GAARPQSRRCPAAVAGGAARDRGEAGAATSGRAGPAVHPPAQTQARQVMNHFIDATLTPLLLLLADWSLRWAVLIAGLGLWFALRPPRRAAVRLLLCRLALLG